MTTQQEGWQVRNVRYEHIHNVDEKDMIAFIECLAIDNGHTIADLMCGYGAVTKHIFRYLKDKEVTADHILVDLFPEQLERSYPELTGYEVERIVADVRDQCMQPSSVDRAVIKMGIHEVPKEDQQTIVNNVYASLKINGIFALWDVMPSTKEDQILFQDIIRKKDQLAGFDSFVKNRYFFRKEEAMDYLVKAGFSEVEHVREIQYRFSSEKRLDAEFGGDKDRLCEFNEYIRSRVPNHLKGKLQYHDSGKTIEMTFSKGIIKGKKMSPPISNKLTKSL